MQKEDVDARHSGAKTRFALLAGHDAPDLAGTSTSKTGPKSLLRLAGGLSQVIPARADGANPESRRADFLRF